MVNPHYLIRYEKFIQSYQGKICEGFVERHHIIPRCKGGNDSIDNLIVLPARAHFIAHYMLHKAYPNDRKLAHAFAMMIVNNNYQNRPKSKLYERAKLARSLALLNVPRPDWVKEKLRKPKTNKQNYKGPKSEEHKKNISKSLKGKEHHWQNKVISSDGFVNLQKRRKEKADNSKQFHRDNFVNLQISRNEYYQLFPDISSSTLKRYLSGL